MRLAWLLIAGCSYAPGIGGGDASRDTAPVFDAARDCPADYTVSLSGQSSRYRILLGPAKAWEHSDDCNNDSPGETHLVAIDDQAELDQVELAIDAEGSIDSNKAWIGGVQLRDQIEPGIGWLLITGGPLIDTAWNPGEPNDTGGNEDNGENFVGIERGRQGLVDFPSDDDQGGMCECDGKPVDPTAATTIDANRN